MRRLSSKTRKRRANAVAVRASTCSLLLAQRALIGRGRFDPGKYWRAAPKEKVFLGNTGTSVLITIDPAPSLQYTSRSLSALTPRPIYVHFQRGCDVHRANPIHRQAGRRRP